MLIKLRYDVESIMKGGEVTLAILEDYSKGFDTNDFDTCYARFMNLIFLQAFYVEHLFIFSYSYN